MGILDIQRESSKVEGTATASYINTINLCLQESGRKEEVSMIPEDSAKPQGSIRQMVGFPTRNYMSQVCTLMFLISQQGSTKVPMISPKVSG